MSAKPWTLYMIRCNTGALYTGISTDVIRRFAEHASGGRLASRYLRGKGPLELVFQAEAGDRALATRLEKRVKNLPRGVKEGLIAGTVELHTLMAMTQAPETETPGDIPGG